MELQEQGQKQRLVSMSEFECGNCKGRVVVRLPQMDVINRLGFSQVIFAHERPAKCPSCGSLFLPLLAGVSEKMELKLVWKLIPTTQTEKNSNLADQPSDKSKQQEVDRIIQQVETKTGRKM